MCMRKHVYKYRYELCVYSICWQLELDMAAMWVLRFVIHRYSGYTNRIQVRKHRVAVHHRPRGGEGRSSGRGIFYRT